MRIGKREREILDYLRQQEGHSAPPFELCHKFAPFYRKAGDRTGSTLGHVVWNRLARMEEKGLIVFHNRGRTDCLVEVVS